MDPIHICENLLYYIKSSNLNYSLNETPFTISINLKKTFIKDKNGHLKSPSFSGNPNLTGHNLGKRTNVDFVLEENKSLKLALAQQ